jgi:hypothetical protein
MITTLYKLPALYKLPVGRYAGRLRASCGQVTGSIAGSYTGSMTGSIAGSLHRTS